MSGRSSAREARTDLFQAAESTPLLWARTEAAPAETVRLFGLDFPNTTLDGAVETLLEAVDARRRLQAVFVNAHVINTAARDPAYRDVVARADLRLSDGSGLAIAARLAGTPFIANTNGTDLFPRLVKRAAETGHTIFLLGGKPGVASRAAETLQARGYGAAIAGTHHGYFAPGGADEADAIAAINASGADILLVGLGVPLQDTWLAANAARITAPVTAGVGGLFDFFAGDVRRAPPLLRALGMEWTWRLALEPGRLWRRYILGNAVFLTRTLIASARRRLTA
jgi:exopolysaccharide biosynthesis WecB/TagA/CpsF family protein